MNMAHRYMVLALAGTTFAAAACGSSSTAENTASENPAAAIANAVAASGLKLAPADANRKLRVASITLAPPARVLTKTQAFFKKLNLGFDVKQLIAAQSPEVADSLEHLDTNTGVGAALLRRTPDAEPEWVVALRARDEDAVEKIRNAWKREGSLTKESGADKITNAHGTFYLASAGQDVIVAKDLKTLVDGGALAVEAEMNAATEELTVTWHAEAGSWQDSLGEQRAALEKMLASKEVAAPAPAAEKPGKGKGKGKAKGKAAAAAPEKAPAGVSPAARAIILAMWDHVMEAAKETDTVSEGLAIHADHGITLRTRVRPKAGTPLATDIAAPGVAKVTPLLIEGENFVGVGGTSASPLAKKLADRVRDAWMQTNPKDAEFAKAVDTIFKATSWQSSFQTSGQKTFMTAPLAAGVTEAEYLDATLAMINSKTVKETLATSPNKTSVTAKRKGDVITADVVADKRALSPSERSINKAMWGNELGISYALTARGGKVYMVMGSDAAQSLEALVNAPEGQIGGPVAKLYKQARKPSTFFYVDLMAYIRPMVEAAAAEPGAAQVGALLKSPAAANATLPVAFIAHGGPELAFELNLPIETATSLVGIAQPFLGMIPGAVPAK